MENHGEERKNLRVTDCDYRTSGAYFVTICTAGKRCLFEMGEADVRSGVLTEQETFSDRVKTAVRADMESAPTRGRAEHIAAEMVKFTFLQTVRQYPGVRVPIFVVMPNHIHAIIQLVRTGIERVEDRDKVPTISEFVQAFKRYSTIQYIDLVKKGVLPPFDKQIWQRSFYDHIIRSHQDYRDIYKYIYENPKNWPPNTLYKK